MIQYIHATRNKQRFTTLMLPNLMEEPWIANRAPANHQTTRARNCENFVGLRCGVNVAIRQHRTGHFCDGSRDKVVVNVRTIHLLYCASMHRQHVRSEE